MATDMGKSQETNNIFSLTNSRRNVKRKFQGIQDRFLRDHELRVRMIEPQSKSSCLSTMGCSCRWSHLSSVRKRVLLLRREHMVAPFQEVGFWHPTIEKTFLFQVSVLYFGTFAPTSWRGTIRAHFSIQAQTMAVGSSSSSAWWDGKTLDVLLKKSDSQSRGKQSKLMEWTRRRPVFDIVMNQLPKMAFKTSIYFGTYRKFTFYSGLL